MTNKERAMKRNGKNMAFVVQKKSTPLRNPRKRGGSPNGVSDPPIFATRKIKKTITCTLCLRSLFARINGRINSIAAPVVPIQDAKTVPIKIRRVLTCGVPDNRPFIRIPPEIVYRARIRMINGKYSNSSTCKKYTEKSFYKSQL